jgi:DNA processing protein
VYTRGKKDICISLFVRYNNPMTSPFPALSDMVISPWREMGAYEALWSRTGITFKTLADLFRSSPNSTPSDFVDRGVADSFADRVLEILKKSCIDQFGIRLNGTFDYPNKLREAEHPVEMLYYRGDWELAYMRSVAIVGTRKPSVDGIARTKKLVRQLVESKFTIVSGLAAGIDTVAHQSAISYGGCTIGVLGTALSQSYPAANKKLQKSIAEEHLLISQVPVIRSSQQGPSRNHIFFPERNITMSALTEATIIIEAGETSGTLTQARAALKQGRKLFILESCFGQPGLSWPAKFEDQGAIRVRTYDDILRNLPSATHESRSTHSGQFGALVSQS